MQVVKALCAAFDRSGRRAAPHDELITFVADRPGHDRRYAIDPTKAERELGWTPAQDFESALQDTVRWYLDNEAWWRPIRDGGYRGERLGLFAPKSGALSQGRLNGGHSTFWSPAAPGRSALALQRHGWPAAVSVHAPGRAELDLADLGVDPRAGGLARAGPP